MIPKKDITAVVLAGGKSSRMGQDKAFLLYKNKFFLEQIIDQLKPLVDEVIVIFDNKNYIRKATLCQNFGAKVVADLVKDAGPVGGIYTAMNVVKTPYLLLLSCDIPLVTKDLLFYVINKSKEVDLNIVSLNGKLQPLIAIYNKNKEAIFATALQQQQLKLQSLFEQLSMNIINCPVEFEQQLFNVNTPQELEQLNNETRD